MERQLCYNYGEILLIISDPDVILVKVLIIAHSPQKQTRSEKSTAASFAEWQTTEGGDVRMKFLQASLHKRGSLSMRVTVASTCVGKIYVSSVL